MYNLGRSEKYWCFAWFMFYVAFQVRHGYLILMPNTRRVVYFFTEIILLYLAYIKVRKLNYFISSSNEKRCPVFGMRSK